MNDGCKDSPNIVISVLRGISRVETILQCIFVFLFTSRSSSIGLRSRNSSIEVILKKLWCKFMCAFHSSSVYFYRKCVY